MSRTRPVRILDEAQGTAIGGRSGSAATADGRLRVAFSVPEALGGPGGASTNPEQLFALASAACLLASMTKVVDLWNVALAADSNVTASVRIGRREREEGAGLAVRLAIDLPGLDRQVALDLVRRAYLDCPYTHATRGGLDLS